MDILEILANAAENGGCVTLDDGPVARCLRQIGFARPARAGRSRHCTCELTSAGWAVARVAARRRPGADAPLRESEPAGAAGQAARDHLRASILCLGVLCPALAMLLAAWPHAA